MTHKIRIDWTRDSAGVPAYTSLSQYDLMTQYRNSLGDAVISWNWGDWTDNKNSLKIEVDSEGTWNKLMEYSFSLNDSDGSNWHPHHQVSNRVEDSDGAYAW